MLVQIIVDAGHQTVNDDPVPSVLVFEEVGDVFEFEYAASTDEGYEHTQVSYELVKHNDGTLWVHRESYRRAKDCDGLMEYWTNDQCSVADGISPAYRPVFERVESAQRDHTAESMGY